MEDVLGRFYLEASETTRACELNQQQYDGYTPDQLRTELEAIASKQVKEWDAFSSPFVPDSPTVDGIRKIVDNCVTCLAKFRAAVNPVLPDWPRESGGK